MLSPAAVRSIDLQAVPQAAVYEKGVHLVTTGDDGQGRCRSKLDSSPSHVQVIGVVLIACDLCNASVGENDTILSSAEVFSPTAGRWRPCCSLNLARSNLALLPLCEWCPVA